MRFPESDQDSMLSVSLDSTTQAGPSSEGLNASGPSNGHTNGNGYMMPQTNGSTNGAGVIGNGVQKYNKAIGRVLLPGTTLYGDDTSVGREEFVRLVIQSLRDVGYIESAATLEAESGYTMEAPEVSEFRRHILEASWNDAEAVLMRLGVTDTEGLWEAKFLIGQQKYLELLESGKTTVALQVLRNELAPLNVDQDQLHFLSSLIMCSDPADLRQRAGWDGASGTSRRNLLSDLHRYIPASIMIPQRRFSTLLHQAQSYQRQHCVYHNSPLDSTAFSLYEDHQCDKTVFPSVTTAILEIHTDEVWNIEWSHDGTHLASGGRDKSAIIWRIGPETEPSTREYTARLILEDHADPVGCLAWSLDDSILLTSTEGVIKMWDTRDGVCTLVLDQTHGHADTVSSLSWLPDGSGFVSGGLDRKIIIWDVDGKFRASWDSAMRVTDLTVTPDLTRVVAVGIRYQPPLLSVGESSPGSRTTDASTTSSGGVSGSQMSTSRKSDNRMIVYNLATKEVELSIPLEGDPSSVKVSRDSRYALINHAPDGIYLWDLNSGRLARTYTGHHQGKDIIRSCFGGIDGNFVVSGSEDGNVYVWHRDTELLLEVLSGHGNGSVNSVAWNPRNERMFATCSDDHTIRIWEAPLSPSRVVEHTAEPSSNGKGKTRQRSNGDSTDLHFGVRDMD